MNQKFERTNAISGDIIDQDVASRWLLDSVVVNRDLSMGLGWKVQFPYLPTWSEADKRALHGQFRALLNSLPEGYDLQVIFTQNHDGAALTRDILSNLPSQVVLAEILRTRAATVRKGFVEERLRFLQGYVIIVRKNTVSKATFGKRAKESLAEKELSWLDGMIARARIALFGADEHAQLELEEYERARKELMAVAEGVDSSLFAMHLAPDLLGNSEVLDLFYQFWNPRSFDEGGRPRAWRLGEMLPITDYYVRSPWVLRPDGLFECDGQYHAIVTVRTPPEQMTFTQWDALMLTGPTKMRLTVNMQRGNLKARIKHLNDKLKVMEAQAKKDPAYTTVAKEIEVELIDLGRDVERIWLATHILHIWADTPEECQRVVREVKRYGLAQDNLILTEETHATWEYWRSAQPFWTRDWDRFREHSYNTTQLVTQLPLVGQNSMTSGKLGAIFETTAGSVFNLYLHSDDFSNYNVLVIGGSGTGKSFIVNDIVAQMSRHRPRTFIVDLGGSFRGMCLAQGGSYVDMDITSDANRVNPFAVCVGATPDEDTVNSLVLFLEKLIVDPVKEGRLQKEQMHILEQALVQTFMRAEGAEFFLRDVRETLSGFTGGAMLAARLAQWTAGGRYAKLFDGTTNADLNSHFTVFDLSKIKGNPDLTAVMFASLIQQVLAVRASGEKFLVFDECWQMLEDEIVASFVVMAFRALRKAGFSTIAISQGIEEFTKTKNKTAILNNLSNLLILRQNTETAATQVAEEFQLSSAEGSIIRDLKTSPGHYSQALIVQMFNSGRRISTVATLRPSALSYWCCTTKPKDRDMLAAYIAKGMTQMDAIKKLAEEFPAGIRTR
jgi:KaiC/GvpD/RAD55 family RecA-like ATPase